MQSNESINEGHYEPMEPEAYFSSTPEPPQLASNLSRVKEFIELNSSRGHCIALVTSGGTTVPLEQQTVRFLDNFSAGTRGATSAEYFIERGYAVIFLHREYSLEPFTRNYTHSQNCFLDYLECDDTRLLVKNDVTPGLKRVLDAYEKARNSQLLIKVGFVTVGEYLFSLRGISCLLNDVGSNSLMYLAAAVSDFFIPLSKMVQHKIQSSGTGLSLKLEPVPKIIKPLVKEWSPRAFVVSFKLETDQAYLFPKSKQALDRYGHQVVIGNLLATRKNIVWMISNQGSETIELTGSDIGTVEIESRIVNRLVSLHSHWMKS